MTDDQVVRMSDLREPSNLELAQLVMVTGQSVEAMFQYLFLKRDILSEETELEEALEELQVCWTSMATWWLTLKEENEEQEVPD